jgi:hypothetical protein
MEAFHRGLGSSFLQWIDNPWFEDSPVVKGPDPEEVHQREKLLDLVLTAARISNLRDRVEHRTRIGVPVRHQRWLPSSSKQAFALLVDRFLIVCASSKKKVY